MDSIDSTGWRLTRKQRSVARWILVGMTALFLVEVASYNTVMDVVDGVPKLLQYFWWTVCLLGNTYMILKAYYAAKAAIFGDVRSYHMTSNDFFVAEYGRRIKSFGKHSLWGEYVEPALQPLYYDTGIARFDSDYDEYDGYIGEDSDYYYASCGASGPNAYDIFHMITALCNGGFVEGVRGTWADAPAQEILQEQLAPTRYRDKQQKRVEMAGGGTKNKPRPVKPSTVPIPTPVKKARPSAGSASQGPRKDPLRVTKRQWENKRKPAKKKRRAPISKPVKQVIPPRRKVANTARKAVYNTASKVRTRRAAPTRTAAKPKPRAKPQMRKARPKPKPKLRTQKKTRAATTKRVRKTTRKAKPKPYRSSRRGRR